MKIQPIVFWGGVIISVAGLIFGSFLTVEGWGFPYNQSSENSILFIVGTLIIIVSFFLLMISLIYIKHFKLIDSFIQAFPISALIVIGTNLIKSKYLMHRNGMIASKNLAFYEGFVFVIMGLWLLFYILMNNKGSKKLK